MRDIGEYLSEEETWRVGVKCQRENLMAEEATAMRSVIKRETPRKTRKVLLRATRINIGIVFPNLQDDIPFLQRNSLFTSFLHNSTQLRFTGSKFETPITAPNIATTTAPPAAMLSKKFFSDGETPGPAASATSGITIDAVRAAAVIPATAFSFNEDRTATSLPLDFGVAAMGLRDLEEGNGLKKASLESGFWLA